jgi:hypothetical protein
MERRERRNFEGMQVEHVVTIPCVLGEKAAPRAVLGLAQGRQDSGVIAGLAVLGQRAAAAFDQRRGRALPASDHVSRN